ncbi:MAG: adenylate kinase [Bacillota bacterium]
MNLTLLGLPGAGKGTQAKKISQDYNLPHIATGDIFRILIEKGTPIGNRADKFIKAGKLVPDKDAIKVLKREISRRDISSGFVLDGFPRTLYQARFLTEMLEDIDSHLDKVFYIKVNPDELVQRVAGRRVCLCCGATYHIFYNPSAKEGICDVCGKELIQRDDDQEDTIRKRISIHSKVLDQILQYYKKQEILRTIAGKDIDDIYIKIKMAIEVEII